MSYALSSMAVARDGMLLLSLCAVVTLSSPVVERQPMILPTCQTLQDCLPSHLRNSSIPRALVECGAGGICVCNQCFLRDSVNNTCFLQPPCTSYSDATGCEDTRLSQLTAFLLSLFLSWVGAANFYIGQLALAIPQLLIGLLVCCLGVCLNICRTVTKNTDDDSGGANLISLILTCICCIPLFVIPLIQLAWWIADLVIFARNARPDNRGCPLMPNL